MSPRTLYNVTRSQELSFLNRQWTLHKGVVNIATSISVDAALDTQLLEEAVRQCIQRWDVFGLRFVKEGKSFKQYFGDREVLYLEHRSFTDDATMERFFESRARKPLPLRESPQAGFVIFTRPDGQTGIFAVMAHFIMDSAAISAFYRDVFGVYLALTGQEPMPKPPDAYERVLQREAAYDGSEQWRVDREFWEREESASQPFFTSLRGSEVLAAYRRRIRNPEARQCWVQYLRTRADHVVLRVDPADVARFQAFLERERVGSMGTLFLLALRLYLARVNGRAADVWLPAAVARRATLAEKNCGGTRVTQIPIRTVMSEDLTFREALDLVMQKQNAFFRHAEFAGLETVMMPHRFFKAQGSRPGTGYGDVMLTFQPIPIAVGHGLKCTSNWHSNGASSQTAYLTVMDDDGSGGLRCYWERQVHHMPVEVIEDCHRFMVAAMRAGTDDPSITVGELLSLD